MGCVSLCGLHLHVTWQNKDKKTMEFVVIPKEKLDFLESTIAEIKDLLHAKKPIKEPPNWISKKEAARQLNVCGKTLDSYLKKGTIPFTQFKSKIYIKPSDIESHLEKYYVTKN